jgi:cation diffusion facilitator family transporter
MTTDVPSSTDRGVRSAQVGMLVNTVLAGAKLVAGLVGNSYALVADAIESSADIVSSLVVWGGLRVAGREADERFPFGYGKAEPMAAAVVALMLLGASVAIAAESVAEIRTPHHTPAPWTLAVLVGVFAVKLFLSRRVASVAASIGSTAVQADAWHHLSDALTSAAAFVGILVALVGGPGWEQADDWAALAASLIIAYNGVSMLRPAVLELMDRTPGAAIVAQVDAAARSVGGVRDVEKIAVRKTGLTYRVTLHVQADPGMRLDDAHVLGGKVKSAIRAAVPAVQSVLVHMEPYAPPASPRPRGDPAAFD